MTHKPKRAKKRPTTDEACARYVELVRGGATTREADALAGVNRHSVRNHPEWGPLLEEASAEYLASLRHIAEDVARGNVEDAQQARVRLAAATWLLGKRDRENYGEHSKTDVAVTTTDDTTAARLAAAVAAAARHRGAPGDGEE